METKQPSPPKPKPKPTTKEPSIKTMKSIKKPSIVVHAWHKNADGKSMYRVVAIDRPPSPITLFTGRDCVYVVEERCVDAMGDEKWDKICREDLAYVMTCLFEEMMSDKKSLQNGVNTIEL